MVVQHITGFQSLSFETLSFLLTLLAATVTPVFVLSEHWIHLPCGCIINCRRNSYALSSEELKTRRRGFEFNLSFQQGYGIYRISPENHHPDGDGKSASCPSLGSPGSAPGAPQPPFSTAAADSSRAAGPGRRLPQAEAAGAEPPGWEWCRSRSERAPRQVDGDEEDEARAGSVPLWAAGRHRSWRGNAAESSAVGRSGGALAIPLCAFQGTVSLQAPTGKTLSLSTYEVSTEGQKITPTSKKIEVYRSKSVGHEPNPEESPNTFADTSVKIHLEVLEICDNEEALDTVSIISNISQSSTQVRSPSLRYSRKENRFVSCDLGETASYSLFIPSNNPDSDINITIPDTVEAHRQNSKKQHMERGGYQEEIQMLNKAYRKREEDDNNN